MFEKKQLFPKIKHNSSILIFIFIAAWYVVTNFIWWYINTPIVPYYDSAAIHFLDIFRDKPYSPPLIPWIMRFMFSVFGKEQSDLIIIAVNYIFFLIPLYFIYKIGEETDSKETGQIAMILFAMVPAVYGLSRQFGHKDYHIIAAITFNIYCLIKTDYFKDRKWAILYGISVGLGLLVKEYFLAYFIPPFFWILFQVFTKKPRFLRIINAFSAIIIGILIAGVHYFDPLAIKKVLTDPVMQSAPIFNFSSIRIITIGLYDELLSLPIFLVCLVGLLYFIMSYKNVCKTVILLWIFVPWTIIFLMPHYKVSEYCAGFIPAMILISAIFITHIKKNAVKKIILTVLIIIGIIQYMDFSYFQDSIFSKTEIKFNNNSFIYYNKNSINIMNFNSQKKSGKIIRLAEFINKLCPGATICVYVSQDSEFNSKALRSVMLLKNMKCLPTFPREKERFILRYDQNIIVLIGDWPPDIQAKKKIIEDNFDMVLDPFYFEKTFGQNNKISILKRKKEKQIGF